MSVETEEPLNEPVGGVEEEPMPRWARVGQPRRYPRAGKWPLTAASLSRYFPEAWARMGHEMPKVAPDSMFRGADGLFPSEAWDALLRKLERVQFDIDQGVAAGNLITSATLRGDGKPVAVCCRACGAEGRALDAAARVCFGGCA